MFYTEYCQYFLRFSSWLHVIRECVYKVVYIYHKLSLQVGCEGPYDITCFRLQKTEVAYKLLALTVSGGRLLFYFWI